MLDKIGCGKNLLGVPSSWKTTLYTWILSWLPSREQTMITITFFVPPGTNSKHRATPTVGALRQHVESEEVPSQATSLVRPLAAQTLQRPILSCGGARSLHVGGFMWGSQSKTAHIWRERTSYLLRIPLILGSIPGLDAQWKHPTPLRTHCEGYL